MRDAETRREVERDQSEHDHQQGKQQRDRRARDPDHRPDVELVALGLADHQRSHFGERHDPDRAVDRTGRLLFEWFWNRNRDLQGLALIGELQAGRNRLDEVPVLRRYCLPSKARGHRRIRLDRLDAVDGELDQSADRLPVLVLQALARDDRDICASGARTRGTGRIADRACCCRRGRCCRVGRRSLHLRDYRPSRKQERCDPRRPFGVKPSLRRSHIAPPGYYLQRNTIGNGTGTAASVSVAQLAGVGGMGLGSGVVAVAAGAASEAAGFGATLEPT
jgi:hypothetical protein